jgi:glutamate formiminotransferase/formiminotetrahydrofolate cyclodeaminase
MTTPNLRDLSLAEFARRLSEKTPTPGGGSVAAHLVGLGAALGCMAFRFTSGPKYAAQERAMAGRAEKAARAAAVQSGFQAAIAVPAQTLELASQALELLAAGAPDLNPNVASDCASGGWCLLGAAEAAFLNVKINAASLSDRAAAEARLRTCEARLGKARAAAASLNASIAAKLG